MSHSQILYLLEKWEKFELQKSDMYLEIGFHRRHEFPTHLLHLVYFATSDTTSKAAQLFTEFQKINSFYKLFNGMRLFEANISISGFPTSDYPLSQPISIEQDNFHRNFPTKKDIFLLGYVTLNYYHNSPIYYDAFDEKFHLSDKHNPLKSIEAYDSLFELIEVQIKKLESYYSLETGLRIKRFKREPKVKKI